MFINPGSIPKTLMTALFLLFVNSPLAQKANTRLAPSPAEGHKNVTS
jgi:hypothetical protein